jgi:putative redox protein
VAKTVDVTWTGQGTQFEARVGETNVPLSSDLDEQKTGPCPMDLLLVALGGCTGMDVATLLGKMRQPLRGLRVEVRGVDRNEDPQIWTDIEVVYHLEGDLDEAKVRRAIELSESTYCCVESMLKGAARITSSYEIERGSAERQ